MLGAIGLYDADRDESSRARLKDVSLPTMTRERQRMVKAFCAMTVAIVVSAALAACSTTPEAVAVTDATVQPAPATTAPPPSTTGATPPATSVPPANDAATRRNPVVAGRASRVFIMAGVGPNCEPLGDPQISIIDQPKKGSVALKPGQLTSIEASAHGTCIGQKAMGTGIYYTAREGETGRDAFTIEARLSTGEMARRAFDIEIIQ